MIWQRERAPLRDTYVHGLGFNRAGSSKNLHKEGRREYEGNLVAVS